MTSPNRTPWLLLASIYTTQYLGFSFIIAAAVAILRHQGVALDKLALINLIAIPLAGKILYAPFIDHYRLFFKGHYRSWLIVAQVCMTALLFITGFLNVEHQFNFILMVLALYTLAAGIQDVAIDGLACKLFNQQQRQLANSLQYSSNLLGNIIGGGVILMLYPWLQWHGALWMLAALTSISWLQLLWFKESEFKSDSDDQLARFKFRQLGRDAFTFIKRHRSWFLLLFIYPIGISPAFAILNPALVDAGWALSDIGFATKVAGSLVGMLSALLAAPIISRLGRNRALIFLTFAQAFALLFMLPVAMGYSSKLTVYAAIFAYFAIYPALLATLSTIIMDRAATMQAKATFFTLQLSTIVVMGFVYSAFSLTLAQHMGYTSVIIITICLTLLIALLAKRILSSLSEPDKDQNLTSPEKQPAFEQT